MERRKKIIPIFIISDSTGTTAEAVISAALVQFRDIRPVSKRFPYTRTKKQISAVLEQARSAGGIVIYSLVSPELRAWIRREKGARDVYAVDLLGPILNRIQRQWDLVPRLEPGLLRGIEEESLRVAEAVDFTLNHDDGQGVESLGRADVIILGVSRTSKTPTSLYLSCHQGLKVANIPIVDGISLPEKIFTLKKQKIGLTIGLERLAFLRRRRWKHGVAGYLDVTHIRKELDYSERLFKRIKGLQLIDVTYSSIEEVSARIMEARKGLTAQAA
jgi:regulator of PEP synthase PpsR (kinase-PPPase family)